MAQSIDYDSYRGLSVDDGVLVTGLDHLAQSLRDIVTTPVGSRVMRRDYGSTVPALLDGPMNQSLIADIIASVAEAVTAWEPRVRLKRVLVDAASPGGLAMTLIDDQGRVLVLAGLGSGGLA
ncbi:GPW/gp25 family protein [Brevundimonas sp.]|jgi:uncharacterized protein|uniref:GPW/gp25 family protein n=1 Tax=Brevundimonas sp. TaxID=1871086 RepID=UPI0025C5B280|nr:GPW/gp25 family protein [Brevundimonas sp.]MCG2663360.1 GPW/gp25 family protein [Brevundimonas sp.]